MTEDLSLSTSTTTAFTKVSISTPKKQQISQTSKNILNSQTTPTNESVNQFSWYVLYVAIGLAGLLFILYIHHLIQYRRQLRNQQLQQADLSKRSLDALGSPKPLQRKNNDYQSVKVTTKKTRSNPFRAFEVFSTTNELKSEEDVTQYFSSSQGATVMQEPTATAVNPNHGLALPGYIQCKFQTDLNLGKQISEGGFGIVYLARAKNKSLLVYGETVVVKMAKKKEFGEEDVLLFHQEVSLNHYFCSHPNIAKILGLTERPFTIILKYYRQGLSDPG